MTFHAAIDSKWFRECVIALHAVYDFFFNRVDKRNNLVQIMRVYYAHNANLCQLRTLIIPLPLPLNVFRAEEH